MELYTLDAQLRRTEVIDQFDSCIWAERFSSSGDFELLINSTIESRALLVPDTMLAMNLSHRVMVIDTVQKSTSEDGVPSLLVKGYSLEDWLKNRIAKAAATALTYISLGTSTMTIASPGVVTKVAHGRETGDTVYFTTTGALPTGVVALTAYAVIKVTADTFKLATTYDNAIANIAINTTGSQSGVHTLWWVSNGKWKIVDTPANIAREIFQKICVDGVISSGDIIPFITSGNLFPADTIAELMDDITVEISIGTVYDVIKEICDVYEMGFRLYRNYDNSELFFNVYMGSDRTTLQSTLPPVVFSPGLDNLTDISQFTSVANYRNVAYVTSPNAFQIVYAIGADATTAGFNRRVLHVDASDIDLPIGTPLTDALIQRGTEELAKYRSLSAFDGKIAQNGKYKYQVDYFLGDLVEMRDSDGVTNNMRVSEQIFISDKEGDRSYPALSVNLFITPGSWFAWDYNQVWDDILDDSDHEWDDM